MARTIEKIQIFDAFRSTMLDYFSLYKGEKEHRRKSTVSHRIAMLLKDHVPQDAVAEIDLDGSDILLLRNGHIDLAVFWSSTYLTEKEKEKAQKYHTEKAPRLTLAFSLLEDKDYLLVYRFEKDYLEYLHIDKQDFSENILKRCMIKGSGEEPEQLLLDIKEKRRKKAKKPTSVQKESQNSNEDLGTDSAAPDTLESQESREDQRPDEN